MMDDSIKLQLLSSLLRGFPNERTLHIQCNRYWWKESLSAARAIAVAASLRRPSSQTEEYISKQSRI